MQREDMSAEAAPYQFWSSKPGIVSVDTSLLQTNNDCLVIVCPTNSSVVVPGDSFLTGILEAVEHQKKYDAGFEEHETFLYVNNPAFPHLNKLVFVSTGPLDRHYDDVRRFSEAACKGIKRALSAGSKRPLLCVLPMFHLQPRFQNYHVAALLGAAEAIYVPLEIREALPAKLAKVEDISFVCETPHLDYVRALEMGRLAARDIGGSDPERMAAPNVAKFVRGLFDHGSPVTIEVIDDPAIIEKEYPLMGAVNRAAKGVSRHTGCVIFLDYTPPGPIEKTLVLVGKGVTYDTGGADIKAGGVMAGMHRDKCGAATVAGFMKTIAELRPPGIKVIVGMAMVRNSVGSDCYVSDEIVTSRAGLRVRVGNTDAEGRMAMTDVLCHLKEKVLSDNLPNPSFFTVATLTGHACLAVGDGYTIVMENGPASAGLVAQSLQKAGYALGDMIEISTLRREDYAFHRGKSEYEDLIQSNNSPSVRTPRGHQCPAAFMIMAAGLDKHDINNSTPLPYCHVDIAASSGPFPGIPSGAFIPALTAHYIKQN